LMAALMATLMNPRVSALVLDLRRRLIAALMTTALMAAALRRAAIVVAARLALMARLMGLVGLMALVALVVRIVRRLVGLMRLVRLMIGGAAIARPGDEGRQVVLDIVAARLGHAGRPMILLVAPAAGLARPVGRHAAATVAAAPRSPVQARLLIGEALARLAVGVAAVGVPRSAVAHPTLAAALVLIAVRPTR
jgi:hypothetical protein